jgi:hypothetical protein
MLFSQVFLLLLAHYATITAAQEPVAHTVGEHYTFLSGGVCRGPGGVNDRINGMHVVEHTQLMCEQACDARSDADENGAHCMGYSYCPNCNGGECLLFGPGLDGRCSDSSVDNKVSCEALGSCDDPNTATKEEECGVCEGKPSALEESACVSLSGTWNKATWTSAGAVWSGAEDPFTGDSHSSKFIAGTSDELASDYSCYDIVVDDHLAHCTGNTTECTTAFDGLEDDSDRIAENCPEGCIYTAKPRGPRNPPVAHAPDIKLPGWEPAQSGACRGGDDFSGKVNGKYSNTAGAEGGPLTQLECAEACLAEDNCVGYAHSTAWCVVYGPEVHLGIGTEEGGPWTSDNHEEVAITGTKVNIAYLCVTGPPRVTADDTDVDADSHSHSHDDAEASDDQSMQDLSASSELPGLIVVVFSAVATAVGVI